MTDTPSVPAAADPVPAPQGRPSRKRLAWGRGFWGRGAAVGGALVAGVALGAGGLAAAATVPAATGWGGHHGPRLERIQGFVRMALDSVGATSDQEAKIHDIVATNFDTLMPSPQDRDALRKQVLDLLRAPTIDTAAVEKLRADQVAKFDARSRTLTDAAIKAAGTLTPEQRATLADRAEAFAAERGPMGGFWHRPGMEKPRHGHGPGQPGDGPDGPAPQPGAAPDNG